MRASARLLARPVIHYARLIFSVVFAEVEVKVEVEKYCRVRDSNRGPPSPQSDVLTTRPRRPPYLFEAFKSLKKLQLQLQFKHLDSILLRRFRFRQQILIKNFD